MMEPRPPDSLQSTPQDAGGQPLPREDSDRRHGFGHRAYQPDPQASYAFRPGQPRMLPKEPWRRWRVPG